MTVCPWFWTCHVRTNGLKAETIILTRNRQEGKRACKLELYGKQDASISI